MVGAESVTVELEVTSPDNVNEDAAVRLVTPEVINCSALRPTEPPPLTVTLPVPALILLSRLI